MTIFHACKHDYKIIDRFYMKSEIEVLVENGFYPSYSREHKSKYVIHFKCSKCKKIKKEVEVLR